MLPIKSIVNQIRITTKDTDSEQNSYKDEELLMYVNAGIRFIRRSISKLNPLLIADYQRSFTLEANENDVDLESNVYRVIEVRNNGKVLSPTNYFEIKDKSAYGTPNKYCMIGNRHVKIFPLSNESCTVDILAINDSGELNLGDTSPFVTDLDDLIIEYAVLRCGMSDRFTMTQETQLFASIVTQLQEMCAVETECIQDGY